MLTEKTLNKKREESKEEKNPINKFNDLVAFIEEKRNEGKMINLADLIERMEDIGKGIRGKEESEKLASSLEKYLDNIRYSDPVLTSFLIESSAKVFNHNWPIKKVEELPEVSSENLWKESTEISRSLDKALGRKLAKRIRRKIKEGDSPEDIFKDLQGKGFGEEVKPLMEEYEARYKSWRDYIEKEAEKIGEKLETYEMLKKMYEEGDIDKEGLVALSQLTGAAGDFANAIFGDYQEKQAARKLLREIRKKEARERKKKMLSKIKKPFRKKRDRTKKIGQKR